MYLWLTALSVLIILVLPAAAAAYMRRKWGSAWIYFSAGAATFLVSQIIHLPLNRLLQELGVLPGSLPNGSDLIWVALILGLSAALSEELIRTAGFAILKKARHFGDGVLIGLGYGGIEAMIVAVILAASAGSFYYFQQLNLLPEGITSEQLSVIEQTIRTAENSPVLAFAPLVERIMALVFQVIFSILVLKAFQTKRWVYVVIAIAYHALVDFAAVSAREYFESIWVTELLIAALLIPGLIWYWQQRSLAAGEAHPISGKLAKELPAFRYSLGKEWLYQLRTKRLIIVAAVFLLFGMVSPLLAKYTPELLSNIEGAEQFAALVPEPTAADAIGQLISNLTQFGFILAILLGMGSVAGEKEKGTAAMMLSKPLPRWVFISSKYLSQGIVYLVAVLLAATAAYYYILFLFEGLEIISFLFSSLLMYLWLMVFAAATILGSTLARSTGAAAGISAAIGVLILLAGTIPKYGILAPGGLITWAGQLALDAQVQPNFGAIATAVVLILLGLITAVGALEQQEI